MSEPTLHRSYVLVLTQDEIKRIHYSGHDEVHTDFELQVDASLSQSEISWYIRHSIEEATDSLLLSTQTHTIEGPLANGTLIYRISAWTTREY